MVYLCVERACAEARFLSFLLFPPKTMSGAKFFAKLKNKEAPCLSPSDSQHPEWAGLILQLTLINQSRLTIVG
eukprot:scaffold5506_cov154-Skeletonema_marinoi.AAC.4